MTEATTLSEPITVDFEDYRKRTFKSINQIVDFAQKEFDIWAEFQKKTNNNRPTNLGNPVDRAVVVARTIRDQAQSYIDNPDKEHRHNILNSLKSHLEAYGTEPNCVPSGSPSGKIILELAKDHPASASILFSSVVGQVIPYGNVTDALRFAEAVYRAERAWENPENFAAAHKSLIKETKDSWQEMSDQARSDIDLEVNKSTNLMADIGKRATDYDRHHDRLFRFFRRQYGGARENLTALENTYHKKLQLEAPATYWRNRKRGHLAVTAIAATIFLLGIFLALEYGVSHGKTLISILPRDNAGNIGLGAIAVLTIPAAAVAWALRIFTRLFSHNLNMATDAAQRQTMITTFLALTNDPKANLGPDERILILNALFRPSENTGSPDAPPPNLLDLAKSVSGKGKT